MKDTDNSFSYSPESDTYRLREIGHHYYKSLETLSSIINTTVRVAEILLFIFNFNRVYKKNPTKKKIELHLYYSNVKKQLVRLQELKLIETVNQKYYHCTETAPFITDIDKLNQYVVSLHSLDEMTPEQFFEFMTFTHSIENFQGLETPINNRRVLVRCFCMCDTFKVSEVCNISSDKQSACMYVRDLKKIVPLIETVFHQDTFYSHVRETDRKNAIYSHQVSQFQKSKAYVLDYEITNSKTHKTYTVRNQFKNRLDKETLEISDRVIESMSDMTENEICKYLYSQIVTKKMTEYRFQCLSDTVYWADKTECEEIN